MNVRIERREREKAREVYMRYEKDETIVCMNEKTLDFDRPESKIWTLDSRLN